MVGPWVQRGHISRSIKGRTDQIMLLLQRGDWSQSTSESLIVLIKKHLRAFSYSYIQFHARKTSSKYIWGQYV